MLRRKMMNLQLNRKYFKEDYTVGELIVDGTYFCDTLEDKVRDLKREKKIPGKTAIPAGRYEVIVNISMHFRRKLPRLMNVPGFDGILIHRGNSARDTAGCILVGENKVKGGLINSTIYELRLLERIEHAQNNGEIIEIIIR